jgi:type I restriction enzyme, S subunit
MKKGWQEKSVGEILQLEYGKPLDGSDRKPNGRFPVYGANGEKDRTDKFYHDKPSIIVGRKGSAGEINLTEKKFWPLDVTYFVTFDEKQHDLRFLYYLLTTLELTKLAKGVKPGINRNEVYSQITKVPPLPEQQRIVGILDKAFEGIASAKANSEKNLQNARALFESHLQSVFTQRGNGWKIKKLGNVCEVMNGGTPKTGVSEYWNGSYLWMTPAEMGKRLSPYVGDTERKLTDLGLRNSSAQMLPPNSVILSSRAPIGHLVINTKPMATNQGCKGLIPNSQLQHKFLYYYLSSIIDLLNSLGTGATFKELSGSKLKEVTIPAPPLPEQQRIIAKLDSLSDETQRLESICRQKLASLNALKKSLLHKAFTGEL